MYNLREDWHMECFAVYEHLKVLVNWWTRVFLCWFTFTFYKNIQNVTNIPLLFLPLTFGYESCEPVPTDIFDFSCLDAIFIKICSYTMIFVTVAFGQLGVSLLRNFTKVILLTALLPYQTMRIFRIQFIQVKLKCSNRTVLVT